MKRVTLDAYVIEVLMPDLVGHDRRPSAFVLFMHLWHRTGEAARAVVASYAMLAEATGLSRRATQDALAVLVRRQLATASRASPTAAQTIALRCPWRRRTT